MKTYTHLDLFSGYGGFSIAARRAGFRTVSFCEIEKDCHRVLRCRFGDTPIQTDVRDFDIGAIPPVDVVTFGSPCQDLSIAGQRKGLSGERSNLFYAAVDIISQLRERDGKPRFCVWENVPGAFSSRVGKDFRAVLQTLLDIGARDIGWRVLDAQWFGVAQRRRRVFLVADFGGECADEILSLSESLRWDTPTRRKAGEDVAVCLKASTPGNRQRADGSDNLQVIGIDGEHNADTNLIGAMKSHQSGGQTYSVATYWDGNDVADCLDSSQISKGQMMPDKCRFPALIEPVAVKVDNTNSNGWGVLCDGTSHTLGGSTDAVVYENHAQDSRIKAVEVSPQLNAKAGTGGNNLPLVHQTVNTLRANAGMPKHSADESKQVCSQMQVRRLTPLECERLMGLSDDWTNVGLSDTARYRMLGNGIVPACVEEILCKIRKQLD